MNRQIKKRRRVAAEESDFENDKEGKLKRTSPGGATIYLEKESEANYTELSNWGGEFEDDPEETKLNKRGSDQSWFKSKPESLQNVPDSFEQID